MTTRRTALSAPPNAFDGRQPIRFCHPGYAIDNQLIQFPRVEASISEQYGIRHRIALLACQIIAGNAFTGYLVNKQYERVTQGLDSVLLENLYYFVIDGQGRPASLLVFSLC